MMSTFRFPFDDLLDLIWVVFVALNDGTDDRMLPDSALSGMESETIEMLCDGIVGFPRPPKIYNQADSFYFFWVSDKVTAQTAIAVGTDTDIRFECRRWERFVDMI